MFKRALLLVVFLCLGVNSIAQTLSPAMGYPTGSSPLAIVSGDFRGDGKLDLVTADGLASSVALLLGNGDGTFAPAVAIPVCGMPDSLAVADFNGDGKLDLAVACLTSTGLEPSLQILYGNGDGTFQSPITILQSIPGVGQSGVAKIVAADINGDGKPDLLAAVNGLTILLNDGTGRLTQSGSTLAGQTVQGFVVADINGDGRPDIAAVTMAVGSGGTTGQAYVVHGNGDGTFQAAIPVPFTTLTPGGIAVGDVNEDGRPDLILSDYGQVLESGVTSGSIQIALQQPDGSFTAAGTLTGIANPWRIVAADFNDDGHVDIAALSINVPAAPSEPNAVFLFLGNGDGSFQSPSQFSLTGTPWDITTGKLSNGRGPDIATANAVSGTISVLVNSASPGATPTPVPAPTVITSNSKNPTSTSFASNNNPAKNGQAISFFATVNPPQGSTRIPTGTVTFLDGATQIGTAALNSSASASISTSTLSDGPHNVSAVYNGDGNFTSSTSVAMAQTVEAPNSSGPTTTPFTIVSSLNPTIYGQGVSFTATGNFTCPNCTSAPGTPSGTVAFFDGGTQIGSAVLTPPTASLTISSLTAGTHNITVQFTSTNTAFGGGSGGPLVEVVNQSSTTTALTSSLTPIVYGQSVAFSVTASAVAPGAGTPTGTVTLSDGTTSVGSMILSGGHATLTLSSLAVANHNMTASYQGDNNFKLSSSAAVVQTVNQSSSASSLSTSVNPSVYGQAVIFTMAVAPVAPGAGTPTGSVTCLDGSSDICNQSLVSGDATFKTSALAVGEHEESASYSGDSDFKASASPTIVQAVNKSATLSTITTSVNPSVYGQAITLQVFVDAVAPGQGTPSGTASFADGNTVVGTVVLDGSIGTLTLPALAVGIHSISVSYAGDNNFSGSTTSLTQTVGKSATAASVTSSLNPAVTGQTVVLTATISAAAPGKGVPTGTLIFLDGTTNLGSAVINSGNASLSISSLDAGTHSITVTYGGDGNFLSSTSQVLAQVVVAPDFSLTLSTSQATITPGQTFRSEIQLAPENGFAGTVSLTCSSQIPQGSCTVTPASGKFAGTTSLTATLTVQTTGGSSGVVSTLAPSLPNAPWSPLCAAAAFLLLPFSWSRKRGRKFTLMLGVAILAVGCGSQSGPKTAAAVTPVGTYTVTVQAQSGSTQHSAQVALAVN